MILLLLLALYLSSLQPRLLLLPSLLIIVRRKMLLNKTLLSSLLSYIAAVSIVDLTYSPQATGPHCCSGIAAAESRLGAIMLAAAAEPYQESHLGTTFESHVAVAESAM